VDRLAGSLLTPAAQPKKKKCCQEEGDPGHGSFRSR
jgi:hypothetical protein